MGKAPLEICKFCSNQKVVKVRRFKWDHQHPSLPIDPLQLHWIKVEVGMLCRCLRLKLKLGVGLKGL